MYRNRQTNLQGLNKDNRGSTLVIVLVCMFFVSIIAAMILSVTIMNLDMKTVEKKASENFYDTESSMEEFNTALRQLTTDAFKEAYEDMLSNYLKTAEADRETNFYRSLMNNLEIDVNGDSAAITNLLISGMSIPAGAISVDSTTGIITIHNVSLDYIENGYETRITTDIVIDVAYPDINMTYDVTSEGIYDSEYVIISNKTISTGLDSQDVLGGQVNLVGNLYAGKDIIINSTPTLLSVHKIIAGESLIVKSSAFLSAVMQTDTGTDNGLWVRNIEMSGGTLNYSGNSYVADDLTMDKENSSVVLFDGEYYGYLFSDDAEADPSKSSSIIINKADVSLDLSGLSKLWLAGNAYIKEPTVLNYDGSLNEALGIMQGESVSYKNMQAAYLIPGACFVGVGHNPILFTDTVSINGTDYNAITELMDGDEGDGVYLDVELNKSLGGIMLEKYVDPDDPYIQRSVTTTSGIGMTYFYLKFKNAKCAADYYQEFITTVRGQAVMAQINNLGDTGIIKYPDASKIFTMGNIIEYSGTDQYDLMEDSIASGLTLLPVRNSLTQKYNAFLLRLNSTDASMIPASSVISSDTTDIFSYLINASALQNDFTGSSGSRQSIDEINGTQYYMSAAYFTDGAGTVSIPQGESWDNTVIITNGNVDVKGNFSGLIIAGGNVFVSSSSNYVETSVVKLNDLIANPDIGKYFNVYDSTTQNGGGSINFDNAIVIGYENWNKN